MNTIKTIFLMGALTVLLVFIGGALGGQSGAFMFFVIAMAMNFFSYFFSDTVAIKMTRSYPVSEVEQPQLYASVRKLCRRADLPMPKLYITPSYQPNAFATGRGPNHAAVAVTEGILQLLTPAELEGVLAHELAHVKNRDILIGTIAASIAGAISMLANMAHWAMIFGRSDDEDSPGNMISSLAMTILAPIAATIIQMAISRSREYAADASGAKIAGTPRGLASALLKLEDGAARIPMEINPAASHMFITNPLTAEKLLNIFSTHPPIKDRVAKLKEMKF